MKKGVFAISRDSEIGKQVESLYADYANGDDYAFAEAFELLEPVIEKVARKLSVASSIPAEEYISAMNEAVWTAFEEYDTQQGACFTTFLSRAVSQKATDVYKNRTAGKHGKYAKKFTLAYSGEDDDGTEAAFVSCDSFEYRDGWACVSASSITYAHFECIPAGRDVEAEVIDSLMNDERRDLIAYLCEKAKAPELIKAIIKAFVENPDKTANKIASALGVHHSKITRSLAKLAGFYDVKRFGDINDYLFRTRG